MFRDDEGYEESNPLFEWTAAFESDCRKVNYSIFGLDIVTFVHYLFLLEDMDHV